MNEIKMIRTEALHPHPENPRKDLGDLTELTESIRKHGVMQNLTVFKIGEEDGYRVLIGHRRLAAAKAAGIEELSCRVIDEPDRKTQLTIMLEENMQRNDLTIIEQAESFQLMLDLGGSVKDIVEKTGFSEAMVYHRLNIAKLDKKTLQKAFQQEDFQLTLNDFYVLEAIEDIKERNRVLSESKSSSDLRWKAKSVVRNETIARNEKTVVKLLTDAGIPRLPKSQEDRKWSLNYVEIEKFDLEKEPKKLSYKHDPKEKDVYYMKDYSFMKVIRLAKKEEPKKSEKEIEEDRKKKRFLQAVKIIKNELREFLISGLVSEGTVGDIRGLFLETTKDYYVYSSLSVRDYLLGKIVLSSDSEEDREAAEKMLSKLSLRNILFVSQAISVFSGSLIYDYTRKKAQKLVENLASFGFSLVGRDGIDAAELISVIYGTHEVYGKGR